MTKPKPKYQPVHEPLALDTRPPRVLNPAARREWKRIIAAMREAGLPIGGCDLAWIAIYSEAHATFTRCSKILHEQGDTYTTARGLMKARPEAALVNMATAQMLAAGKMLGLSPAARARLAIATPEDFGIDPMDLLLASTNVPPMMPIEKV